MGNPSSTTKSDTPAVDRPRVCRGEKRREDGDEVSVDLSLRGRWADRAGRKRRRGNGATPLPAGDKVNGSFLLFYGYTVLVALDRACGVDSVKRHHMSRVKCSSSNLR